MKKILSVVLSFAVVCSMSAAVFAAGPMSLNEAKEYLKSYNVIKENTDGKEYSTQYIFKSEKDLDNAATYIVDNGLDAFNVALDGAIAKAVSKEPKITVPHSRTTDPDTAFATVTGDGTHSVHGEAYGLAHFDTLGTVEYLVELGYQVKVTNGKFTDLTGITFDIPTISAAGSWGNTAFPSYRTDTNCGVTANYVITKSVQISIGDFSFEVKSETDNENFALLTSIR